MKKVFDLFLFLGIIVLCSCSESTPEFANDWDEDVYFFGKNLKDNHIDLFFNISESEFESDIKTLRDNSSTYTEQKILIELSKIISKIGDSHTQLQFTHKLSSLPFNIQLLDDGLLLTEVAIEHSQHLGKKITEINSQSFEEVLDLFRTVISYENESNFKNQIVQYLRFSDFYFDFGISDSSDEITLKLEDGGELLLTTLTNETTAFETTSLPYFLKDTKTLYWFEELEEDNIIYIQYNACRERNDLSFQSFTNQIVNQINNNNNINKLVVDLRHNGGGNSAIMKPLIDEMENYISENRFTKNQIFLIIGRNTFSSAVLNTIEMDDRLENVILGEPTGGKPNHYGEVKSFRLPNSLLNVTYSTKYFDLVPSNDDSFKPDISVEYNSDHFLNGIDPVLEKIKEF